MVRAPLISLILNLPKMFIIWYRKINTSSTSVDDKDILTKPLVTPLVRVIDLQFPLGTVVTARNKHGVTIKDAMDAIYKTQKKKVSSLASNPLLLSQANF